MIEVWQRWLGRLALVSLGLYACKRPQTPTEGPVWDEEPGPAKVEALGTLSPPWDSPVRILFDNDLLTFWLHEPDTPSFHLRVLLPIAPSAEPNDVVALHVAAETIRARLARALRTTNAVVELDEGPGRLELAVHGRNEEQDRLLAGLAEVMQSPPDSSQFTIAAREVSKRVPARPSSEAVAVAGLTARLLGRDPESLRLDRHRIAALSASRVGRAWKSITDPTRAVLIVHAGTAAKGSRAHLDELARQWSRPRERSSRAPALVRLRLASTPPQATGRLLAQPQSQLEPIEVQTEGKPIVAIGRIVPTPDGPSRSRARLAQRILQEEMDARLTIMGDLAVFVVVIELEDDSAAKAVERAIRSMSAWSRERQPVQRLFQAAQLWLGARVVQASLSGEDWTALWTDALDLAGDDEEVALALAQDAATMLQSDPDRLTKWQSEWLDPMGGTAGWHWVVSGANQAQRRSLGGIVPLDTKR